MGKVKRVIKNHPPQEVINKIREELSASDYPYKNVSLSESPTGEEKLKYEICQTIARYKRENNLSEQELVKKLGIENQDKLKNLLLCHISKLSLTELVNSAERLSLSFEVKINSKDDSAMWENEWEKSFPNELKFKS